MHLSGSKILVESYPICGVLVVVIYVSFWHIFDHCLVTSLFSFFAVLWLRGVCGG